MKWKTKKKKGGRTANDTGSQTIVGEHSRASISGIKNSKLLIGRWSEMKYLFLMSGVQETKRRQREQKELFVRMACNL